MIHPFAGWKAKEWGLHKYIKLASHLSKDYDVAIICESHLLNDKQISEIKVHDVDLILTKSIEDLITAVKDSSVMISNDTGPIHIANILGKATFTIYGPTNPNFHLPRGQKHGYIRKEISCSPGENDKYCFTYGGRYCQTFECMKLLEFDIVKKEIIQFLNSVGIKKTKKESVLKD